MRNSTQILSACRLFNDEASATYAPSRTPVWLMMAALVLALGACGTPATTDTGGGEPDVSDDADIQVEPDTTTDASSDIKTGDSIDKPDAKDAGDTGPTACTTASDCQTANGNPSTCHVWVCSNGQCDDTAKPAPAGTACDDGKLCSAGDKCDATGVCQPGTDPNPQKDPKTGNLNTCLVCTCANNPTGDCTNVTTSTNTPCDDGNACSKNDSCQAGGVCIGAVDPPPAATTTCYTNVCDPATGIYKPKADANAEGKPCDDGDACTIDETCAAGLCVNSTPLSCTSSTPCKVAACDKKLGCQTTPVTIPVGTTIACDDTDACTENDQCLKSGTCKGTSVTVGVQTLPCQVVNCDSATGQLTYAGAADGAKCTDGDPCTKLDACSNAQCKGSLLVCNDGNPCTDDACDPLKCSSGTGSAQTCGQCVAPPKGNGDACDDGNKCTTGDVCSQGACSGLPTDCDDKNTCTNDSCQPGSGCLHTPVTSAAACDDGNSCTIVDKCVGTSCKGTTKDCADTDPCTSDACDQALPSATNCTHLAFNGPCDDGDNCTSSDLCLSGKCAGNKVDCDDGNPCTNDLCDSIKKCQHIPLPGGTQCDDGLACTQNDYCDLGKCTQLPADNKCNTCNSNADCAKYNDQNQCNGTIKCIDSYKGKVCDTDPVTVVKCDTTQDNSCTKNTCNPDNGVCGIVKANAGTICTGDKCLDNAQCDGLGSCKGIAKNCDDKNDCTTDTCDSTSGCKNASAANGSACDDGSICTPKDSCQAGKCVGDQNTCSCTTNSQCAGFDDGNLCNGVLTCQSGLCQADASTIVICGVLTNSCQNNVCTPATGQCKPVAKADNVKCDDNNKCTVGEVCLSATCTSTTLTNCDDNNPCTQDFCDKAFGCGNAPMAAGGVCDDGNDCTTKDSCKTGACLGTLLNCDDGNPCTSDTCTKKGGCAHTLDDTLSCTDGNACTKPDHCKDGVCLSTAMNCDDNNSCTIDACDGAGGCKNVVYPGKDCDDGNACTVQDTCVNDKCVGKAKSCDDGNACTNDSCQDGTCIFTAATGKPCSDSNACTGPDFCTGDGQCIGGTTDCTTGTVCKTLLTCSPVTGCVVVPNDGANCDDGDACTGTPPLMTDKCKGGGCSGPAISCNDNNICTNDKCDNKLGCIISQNTCDDANPCTVDTCDQTLGCQHQNVNGGFCDDGDACTANTTCDTGACKGGAAVVCDDKNDCTGDTCDKIKGCASTPLADGVTCTDGDVCTTDTCTAGKCVGVALSCDDGNACTKDECNPVSGCIHSDMAEKTPCDDGESCTLNTVCQGGSCSGGTNECPQCTADVDCAWMDSNGNACDGRYFCVNSTVLKGKYCKFDPTIVACDSTGDGPCVHNTCNQTTGACAMTQSLNGASCEDGKGCTVNDTCYNGACKSGALNDCASAKNACNGANCVEDSNAAGGFKCVAIPLDPTTACDADANGCTANDHCSAGKCVSGTPVDCSGVAGSCQVGSCKSTGSISFTCQTSQAADNAACDDKQLCTVGDYCLAGVCKKGLKTYDCSAQTGVCSLGFCDSNANKPFGSCVPTPLNEGQPCDADGNGCTQGDQCVQGFCVAGIAPNCNGFTTECATGACKAASATTFACVGAPKADKLPCEADNNGCTEGDACLAGACVLGPARDCSAMTSKDGCQIGTCKSLGNASNTCVLLSAPVATPCNADNSGCTKGDACNALGGCQPGPVVDCNGLSNACATGACVSTSSQTFVCNGNTQPNGTACDADGDGCTQHDSCQAGVCKAGAAVDCGVAAVQCWQKKCSSTAYDSYTCQDLTQPNNTVCDADQNGCTVGDFCIAGNCQSGTQQTCLSYQKDCNLATCGSTGVSSYACNVKAVTSYGPLSPPVTCVSTASPGTCPTGYKCTENDATTHAGTCEPSVIVSCNDGNNCTTSDYCASGTCNSGPAVGCDDGNPCTTDSCNPATGACQSTPIVGCGMCLNESFATAAVNMVVRSRQPSTADWTFNSANADYEVSWNATTWQDPASVDASTRLVARKLYLQATGATQLEFDLQITGAVSATDGSAGCVDLYINDTDVLKACGPYPTKQHFTQPLTAWAGAPVDIAFKAAPGPTKPTGTFLAQLDNVTVTGLCSTTCVGVDFEPRAMEANDLNPYVMPQSWKSSTTDATYVDWATTATAGHTGLSEMVTTWTGKPTSGTTQVAKMTIPQVSVVAGNILYFAAKASFGDETCGADDLSVRVNTATGTVVELLKQCSSTSGWTVKSYDLSAYANTTVDIDIVVTTGSGTGAKGTVEIDDVAISGTCNYLCFSDDFETGGIAKWSAVTTDTPSKFKAWAATTALAVSGTTSAFAQYDVNATASKLAYLYGDRTKGTLFQLPVLGASMTAQVNSFAASPPSDCATVATSGIFWSRVTPQVGAATVVPTTIAELAADLTEPFVTWNCDSSGGWTKVTSEIVPKSSSDIQAPSFYLVKQAQSTSAKVYIDDVQVICQ